MLTRLKTAIIVKQILAFLGTAPDALRGHLNLTELVRIVVATVLAGGGAYEVVRSLAANIAQWVAPGDVGLATAAFVLIIEVWRRLNHGDTVVDVEPFEESPPDSGA
jgi:hypothetical protein